MATSTDLLIQNVTQDIIDRIEASKTESDGIIGWNINWTNILSLNGMPINHDTNAMYSGINVLLLSFAKAKHAFTTSRWLTYKQAQKLGLQVKKGEKGSQIVKIGTFIPKDRKDGSSSGSNTNSHVTKVDDNAEDSKRAFLKVYTVFNLCQIDGVDYSIFERPTEEYIIDELLSQACKKAKYIVDNCGAKLNCGHSSAFYRPDDDAIYMPSMAQFSASEDFYAVFFHELTHWSGAKHRLDRDKKYGTDTGRAYEELIAELGSAFICTDVGINSNESAQSNAGYIQGWLKVLKDDPKMIMRAASAASKAFVYIHEMVKANYKDKSIKTAA